MGANNNFFNKSRNRLVPSNFVSLWSFEDNNNDSIGSNNIPPTTYDSYVVGLIGKAFDFSSPFASLEADNNINLSFTDGANDIEGGFSMLIKFNSVGSNQIILNKRNNFGSSASLNREYQINHNGTSLNFTIFDQVSGGYIIVSYPWTPTISQWYQLQCYYDGSGLHTGLKMYVDGVSVGTTSLTGTYISNQNYNTKFVMGTDSWGRTLYFNGELDEIKKSKIVLTDAEALELATKELAGIKVI
jgi:hypothetical protein